MCEIYKLSAIDILQGLFLDSIGVLLGAMLVFVLEPLFEEELHLFRRELHGCDTLEQTSMKFS